MNTTSHAAVLPYRSRLGSWFARHPLLTYFTLAYAFSWAIEIPLAARAQGWTRSSPPYWLHYLAGYGPALAAVVATALVHGRGGLADLAARVVRWRVRPVWWLAALSPVVLYAITAVILRVTRGAWIDVGLLGRINFLPALGPAAFVLWLLTYGVGEETGWRGFALPHLQQGRNALSASLLLAAAWIGWHLPTFFYLPTYVGLGPRVLPMFVLGIVAGAIVFTWLYNGSGGSVLMAILAHAALNFTTASPVGEPLVAAVVSTTIMAWAVIVIVVWKPGSLAPRGKQIPAVTAPETRRRRSVGPTTSESPEAPNERSQG